MCVCALAIRMQDLFKLIFYPKCAHVFIRSFLTFILFFIFFILPPENSVIFFLSLSATRRRRRRSNLLHFSFVYEYPMYRQSRLYRHFPLGQINANMIKINRIIRHIAYSFTHSPRVTVLSASTVLMYHVRVYMYSVHAMRGGAIVTLDSFFSFFFLFPPYLRYIIYVAKEGKSLFLASTLYVCFVAAYFR